MRFYPLERLINLHDNYTRQFKIDHMQLSLQVSPNQFDDWTRCPANLFGTP